jgi:predicted small metal-binding protein
MKEMNMKTGEKVHRVSCEPECGFMVQSHDEKELIDIVKDHAKSQHKMKVSDSDVKMKMVAMV